MQRNHWGPILLGCVAAIATSVVIQKVDFGNAASAQTRLQSDEVQNSPGFQKAYALSDAFRQVSKASLPAVVSIRTTGKVVEETAGRNSPSIDDPWLRRFLEQNGLGNRIGGNVRRQYRTPSGMGSGFIIDEDGLVMTNAHVVQNAGSVIVRLADGREFTAQDVRADAQTDVAVLRIDVDEKLPFLPLGNDERMEIGDWVLAFGSPFGLDKTVTQGIISAKGRAMGNSSTQEYLQTDAAINPGNSGGPLVNLRGEVVGINTAISTRSGGYDGVSLAVPVTQARWVAEQFESNGLVKRAYIGIGMQEISADLAPGFGLKTPGAVAVTSVVRDSPADKAGFREGDVILAVDGRKVSGNRNMLNQVQRLQIGKTYRVQVQRDGRERELRITVAERPADLGNREIRSSGPGSRTEREEARITSLGIAAENFTQDYAQEVGIPAGGVLVTRVERNSAADRAGLVPGMLIVRGRSAPIQDISDLEKTLNSAKKTGRTVLLVKNLRNSANDLGYVTVSLDR